MIALSAALVLSIALSYGQKRPAVKKNPKITAKPSPIKKPVTAVKNPKAKGGIARVTLPGNERVSVTIKKRGASLRPLRSTVEEKEQECEMVEVSTMGADFDQFKVAGNDNFVAKIIPGVIYDFNQIQMHANYNVVDEHLRRRVKLYVNEPAWFNQDQVMVQNPHSTANLNSAVGTIMSSNRGNGASNSVGSTVEVFTEEDFALQISGGGSYMATTVDAELDFNSSSSTYKYLYDLMDPYYTISAETTPNGFFKDETLNPSSSWAFVRSVTYGRRLIVLIETAENLSEFSSDVSADVNAVMWSANASVSTDFKSLMESASIKIYAYGGSVAKANALQAAGSSGDLGRINDALEEYIEHGATDVRDAKPLAYELADLDGNTLEAEIDPFNRSVRRCSPLTRKYEIRLEKIKVTKVGDDADTPNYLEIYGSHSIRAYDEKNKEIMDTDGSNQIYSIYDDNPLLPNPVGVTFANESAPLKIGEDETETFGEFNSKNGKRFFEMPKDEDEAYFKIEARPKDEDKFSKDDVYTVKNTGKIRVKDIFEVNQRFTLSWNEGNDKLSFTYLVKKIYD